MNLDFFRRDYDKIFSTGHYGLDEWVNSDSFYETGTSTGFFCFEIIWHI